MPDLSREEQLQQINSAMKHLLRTERIIFYAESLYEPWKNIYAGEDPNPTLDEIRANPGPWLLQNPFHNEIMKPFAHLGQRQITYPWESPELLERWKGSTFFIDFAGNRNGKSVCLANFMGMLAIGRHPLQKLGLKRKPPVLLWVISPNLPSESEVPKGQDAPILKKFYEWIPDMEAGHPWGIKKFYRKDKMLSIVSPEKEESVIVFKSLDQEINKFKSDDVDGIGWDEDPKSPSKWEEGKMRLIDRNGVSFLAMTPDYDSVFTYQIRQKEKQNPQYYFTSGFGPEENPFLPREAAKKIISNLSKDSQSTRGKGEHVQFKGKVFPFDPMKHVGRPFTPSKETTQYVIIDWHPAKPIMISYLSIDVKGIWYVWDESSIESHVVEEVAKEYNRKLIFPDYKVSVRKNIIDKIAQVDQVQDGMVKPKSVIDMLRAFGIRCEIGKTEFEGAHAFLTRKLNYGELWIDPKCTLHIEQWDTWGAKRYQKGNLEGTIRDQLEGEGNDTCMNLVYAHNAGAKWVNPNERPEDVPWTPPRSSTSRIYGRRVHA